MIEIHIGKHNHKLGDRINLLHNGNFRVWIIVGFSNTSIILSNNWTDDSASNLTE